MSWTTTLRQGLTAALVAVAGIGMVGMPMDADAKRLGSGRPAGMQRQMPPKQPAATPDQAGKPVQQQNAVAPQPGAAQQAAGTDVTSEVLPGVGHGGVALGALKTLLPWLAARAPAQP